MSRRAARGAGLSRIQIRTRQRQRRQAGALSPRRWYPGMACSICGEQIRRWQQFNWDHGIPVSLGGKRGRANKAYAHCLCNFVKGNRYPFSLRTPAEREAVRRRLRPRTWQRLEQVWAGG